MSSCATGLEVIPSGDPTVMREGISSSPHSSPLDLPLSLSGKWNLQLIDINSAQDLWSERSCDLGESGNLIWPGRIDNPPTWQGGKGLVIKIGLHNVRCVLALCVLYCTCVIRAELFDCADLISRAKCETFFNCGDPELPQLWLLRRHNKSQSAVFCFSWINTLDTEQCALDISLIGLFVFNELI